MKHITIATRGCSCCTKWDHTRVCAENDRDFEEKINKALSRASEDGHYVYEAVLTRSKYCDCCGALLASQDMAEAKRIIRAFEQQEWDAA